LRYNAVRKGGWKVSLGKRLKTARNSKGLTQEEVAKKIGITFQALSNYERDYRDPDTALLAKIAETYGVSIDYLLGRSTDLTPIPPPPKESTLTKQDRDELKRDAEYIKNAMMSVTGLAFNSKPKDEETLEKVMLALEEAMILARKEAQRKYTPKKYRKKEE